MVLRYGRIGQFNCDNRSQQHVEAIYRRFDFIGPTRTSRKTSNRKLRDCRKIVVALNDSQVFFHAHVHSLDRRSRNAHDHFEQTIISADIFAVLFRYF